jgi:hypothetical protein
VGSLFRLVVQSATRTATTYSVLSNDVDSITWLLELDYSLIISDRWVMIFLSNLPRSRGSLRLFCSKC